MHPASVISWLYGGCRTSHGHAELRKARGAFFTPEPIAPYCGRLGGRRRSCGNRPRSDLWRGSLLAGRRSAACPRGCRAARASHTGARCRPPSGTQLVRSAQLLEAEGLAGTFLVDDFFGLETPERLGAKLPQVDAVIGNPPFVRYQNHTGLERKRAQAAHCSSGGPLVGACLFMGRSRRPLLWIPEARGPSSNGAPRRASDDRLRGGSSPCGSSAALGLCT